MAAEEKQIINNLNVDSTEMYEPDFTDTILGPEVAAKPESVTPIIEEAPFVKSKEDEAQDEIFGEPVKTTTKKPETAEETPIVEPTQAKPEEVQTQEEEVNTFQTLAEELLQLGVFSAKEEETPVTTPEEFLARFKEEVGLSVDKTFYDIATRHHGEAGLKAIDAILNKGMDPRDYFQAEIELQDLDNLDITDESNQELVVREYLTNQGWKPEKINKYIQRTKDDMELENEAKDALEELKTGVRQDQAQKAKQAEQQVRAQLAFKQQTIQSYNAILAEKLKAKDFDGIPVTDKVANETMDYLSTEKYQLPTGEKLTQFDVDILELKKPENHAAKVKLALLLRNGLDLTKVKQKAVTQETNKLFDKISRQQQQTTKRQETLTPQKSFTIGL